MADREKLQRLKAAKKKVKEHKLKMQKGVDNQKDDITEMPESVTSSIHSNDGSLPDSKVENSQAVNYFNPSLNAAIDPIAFFDNIPTNNPTAYEPQNIFTQFVEHNNENYAIPNNDPGCIEYPDFNPNEIFDRAQQAKAATPPPVITNDTEEKHNEQALNNVESLRQLSSQMTQLVDLNTEFDISNMTSNLERRNQELAYLLNSEKLKTEQLNAEMVNYNLKIGKLQEESVLEKSEFERKISDELVPLREQLQTHMQTVGILVGEKSELSATLSQSQLMLKQKTSENEELNARLKTSRSRVADLEKELNNLRHEKNQYDKIGNEHNERIQEYEYLKSQKDDADQHISELKEKLNVEMNSNSNQQKEIQELKAQLSLADIKIQQLTAGESTQSITQIESLTQQKLLLEKNLNEMNQSLKTISQERDQASHQYQQYVQQLNGQLTVLAQKLEIVTQDNETLSKREQNLVKHISELERHLQNLQNEHINNTTNHSKNDIVECMENLQIEKSKLENNFTKIRNERDELLKEILEKKNTIEELVSTIEQLRVDQPDSAKLLATIESDKVAAARAVTQNKQLKEQLEEMQTAFIKTSNDKMELTEKLETERHQNRELIDKLQINETHLFKLTEAIEIKDRELTQMRQHTHENDKNEIQFNQLEDRLRHYEAQENSYHALQNELKQAQQQIELYQIEKETIQNTRNVTENSIHQEVTQEITQEDIQENNNKTLEISINKELAMRRLEEKFTKTMENCANLQDEKQSLEHLVLQLQGETETIGEYIMLYQHQRAVLKQRAIEKEEQIKRLAGDKEEMRNKLEKLNELIERLMTEKSDVPADILEQHRNMQKENLCIEHAKLQNEINDTNGTTSETTKETAEKIIALLSEIKTSNLVQSDENFHPCPWCSGQLINI